LDTTLLIQELLQKIDQLTARVEQLEKENHQLGNDVQELRVENAELKARLNTNSKNSSKPPSQDGYSKKPAMPKAIKGQQGGQNGHSGTTLQNV
jgi:transposase